jgi:hypothetical protein
LDGRNVSSTSKISGGSGLSSDCLIGCHNMQLTNDVILEKKISVLSTSIRSIKNTTEIFPLLHVIRKKLTR